MAKVTLVFEDEGKEGDARVTCRGEPDFNLDGDPNLFTSAQMLAFRVIDFISTIDELPEVPDHADPTMLN